MDPRQRAMVQEDVEDWRTRMERLCLEMADWGRRMGMSPSFESVQMRQEHRMVAAGISPPQICSLLLLGSDGSAKVRVIPTARWIVGASGRADLWICEVPSIVVDTRKPSDPDSSWHVVADRSTGDLVPLDETVFQGLVSQYS